MKISGYTTLRNPVEMNYPFEASIRSLFPFCDEIVVCDTSDGKDGTDKILKTLEQEFDGDFKVVVPDFVDWDAPNHGIYDGQTKAFAREQCTGDYCFQIDADEVVDATRKQIEQVCSNITEEFPLIALPVVEYWGSKGKVRIDVNPWKERLSLNSPMLTHGIPGMMRVEHNGLLYARPGTDGCNIINRDSLMPVDVISFVTNEVERVRQAAQTSQPHAELYEKWFNKVTDKLPTIYHFSWYSVYEKMRKYKLFWNNSWQSLYNEQRPEGYNPFFNKPFDQVSDEEMREEAEKLETKTGGHIFHQPWDGTKKLHVTINKPLPELAKEWAKKITGE